MFVIGRLLCSLVLSWFLDFYVSWSFAVLSLHWGSNQLLHSLLTGFCEKYIQSTQLGILRLSENFSVCGYACFTFLVSSSWWSIRRLYAFSWCLKARPGADSLLGAFPRTELNAQLCAFFFFFPVLRGWACFLCAYQPAVGSMSREMATRREYVCVRHMECWGCLWATWEDLQGRRPRWLMDGLRIESVTELVESMSFDALPEPYMDSPSCVLIVLLSVQDRVRKKWVSSSHLGKLGTHPHIQLSPVQKLWSKSFLLAVNSAVLGEGWCG